MVKLLQGTWRAEGTEEAGCLALSFSPQSLAEQRKREEAERALLCMQETDKQIPIITTRVFLKIDLSWEFSSQVGATWKKYFALKAEKSLVEGDPPPWLTPDATRAERLAESIRDKGSTLSTEDVTRAEVFIGKAGNGTFHTAQSNASQSCIVWRALTVGAHRSRLRNFPVEWWDW